MGPALRPLREVSLSKGIRFSIVSSLLLVILAPAAFAQTSATSVPVSASANIIPGISITNTSALSFGDFIAASNGAVVLGTNDTLSSVAAGVTPAGGIITSAAFTVTSSGSKHFSVNVPASVTLAGPANITVDQFSFGSPTATCNATGCTAAGAVGASSSTTLKVGARLNLVGTEPTGSYASTFTVTVSYF